jgi:hypothetical protein
MIETAAVAAMVVAVRSSCHIVTGAVDRKDHTTVMDVKPRFTSVAKAITVKKMTRIQQGLTVGGQ